MASTPEQKKEGTIASRLRSSFKKTFQTKEGIEGKPIRLEKDINKIKAEKVTKKSGASKTKDSSSKILNSSGKEEMKDNEPTSSKQQASKKPIKQQPRHYIQWDGTEDTSMKWNCDLCRLNLANKEEQEHSNQHGDGDGGGDGDELQYYLLSSQGGEEDLRSSVLPEVAVLPCSHVFHITCLSAPLTHLTDPPCPICDPATTSL
ncbi:uncharacterized protein LOC127089760 [Lathyrus oleraceus]|uniref:RING-type domain-containing protein n=1 Tax=Pisum sativum TaxID=3888 RepID=A0A9D4YMN0_PEA|nr:uncharacterized protein LOC127089760 [Pisum sativum]KAI5441213.1 hypothetical protein KIW84_010606 [Pisum sativum]